MDEFDEFADALRKKFWKVVEEDERTPTPWANYDADHLYERLKDEVEEYEQGMEDGDGPKACAGECIDIGNFAMFLWKLHMTENPEISSGARDVGDQQDKSSRSQPSERPERKRTDKGKELEEVKCPICAGTGTVSEMTSHILSLNPSNYILKKEGGE